MDIITVNGSRVIRCPHCAGSGMCKQAVEAKSSSGGYVLSCMRCGNGPNHIYNISADRRTPPVCKICDGKGFNAI